MAREEGKNEPALERLVGQPEAKGEIFYLNRL
jgi:hypothetical protein